MGSRYDQEALCALSDALADAATLHYLGKKTADDPLLSRELAAQVDRLRNLSAAVRDCADDGGPGTMLRLIDEVRLAVDSWFGDDDAAAVAAAQQAQSNLLALIDDHLEGGELSGEVHRTFVDVRTRIAGRGTPDSQDSGLKSLAR